LLLKPKEVAIYRAMRIRLQFFFVLFDFFVSALPSPTTTVEVFVPNLKEAQKLSNECVRLAREIQCTSTLGEQPFSGRDGMLLFELKLF
jgi:hypothetical protein